MELDGLGYKEIERQKVGKQDRKQESKIESRIARYRQRNIDRQQDTKRKKDRLKYIKRKKAKYQDSNIKTEIVGLQDIDNKLVIYREILSLMKCNTKLGF